LTVWPWAFAVVAMPATFGAGARAPLASIVFLFELTRDYNAILPLMLATVVADLLARTLTDHSIMTEKLARRGVSVPVGYHADPLRTARLRTVMRPALAPLEADAVVMGPNETLYAALVRMVEKDVDAVTVVERGEVVGTCTRADLLDARVSLLDLEQLEPGWLARRA